MAGASVYVNVIFPKIISMPYIGMAKIHCPNCEFEGRPKDENQGCLQLILVTILFIISCFFPLLFLITLLVFIYFLFQGKKLVCPKCRWKSPIPLKHWQETQANKLKKRQAEDT